MAWTIAGIRSGLETRLLTIPGLYVYPKAVGGIVVPAAMVLLGDGQFLTYDSSSDSDDLALAIRLFVSRAGDGAEDAGQDALDAYLARTGSLSIRAAVAAEPTLGGACDYAVVAGASNYGTATVGAVDYFGCEFPVDVAVS